MTCWSGIGAVVELHVEQGRALAPLGAAIGLAEGIWPHGRWRLDFQGQADHAGTARLADRRDPMLAYARTVLAARDAAAQHGSVATFGKVIADTEWLQRSLLGRADLAGRPRRGRSRAGRDVHHGPFGRGTSECG